MSFFDEVERELVAAATRRARRALRLGGTLAVAGAVVAAGGALAATGTIELGSPDPPVRHSPEAAERGIGVPQPGSSRLLGVRTPDPTGGPPWGIRVFRSSRGYRCAQYGRVVEGRLVRIGRDGKAHELALHCRGNANLGSFGNRSRLFYGYVGPRARQVIFERTPDRVVLPVRDGAYLAVFAHPLRRWPRITVVLDDGTHVRQSPSAPSIPGTLPPPQPRPPRVKLRHIRTGARTIAPREELLVTFKAPLAIRDGRTFYRAEANGPHARGCAGRVLAGSDRNFARGDQVRLRLRLPYTFARGAAPRRIPWCRGSFRGRVSINGRRTVGTFALTVR
jgi:hypothetical protein